MGLYVAVGRRKWEDKSGNGQGRREGQGSDTVGGEVEGWVAAGVELEVTQEEEGLFLRPLVPKPVRVRSGRKWGRETFPDAGEATFGG